ncbi:MAG: HNH endonuclease [Chloroflexi bacterium]|nr:HNH endonuclease [Chloroflexota bacterium]
MISKPIPRPKVRKRLTSKPHVIPSSMKEAVYERDSFTCQWCKVPGGALDAHHVTRRSQMGKDELSNLISVHRLCHRVIHENPSWAKERGFLA